MKKFVSVASYILLIFVALLVVLNICLLIHSGYVLDESPTPVHMTTFTIYAPWVSLALSLILSATAFIAFKCVHSIKISVIVSILLSIFIVFNLFVFIDHFWFTNEVQTAIIARTLH